MLQESHASPVHQLMFNYTNKSMQNLFATVGKDQVQPSSFLVCRLAAACFQRKAGRRCLYPALTLQATVYDDLHMGDFIAVVVNFTNQKTDHAVGGVRSSDNLS